MATTKFLTSSSQGITNLKPLSYTTTTITEIEDDESGSDYTPSAVRNGVQSQSAISDFSLEVEHFQRSFEILEVLEKYGRHINIQNMVVKPVDGAPSEPSPWIGKHKFLTHVYHHVSRFQPIQLTMPAFPCKSLNRKNKVLGHLPDLGEELALSRLHAMGEDIKKVYTHGAVINIASDGVLFNDVLGITDEDCWDYGEELQAIIREKNLSTLRLVRCMSLLEYMPEEDITKETYLATVDKCRQELEARFAPTEDTLTKLIKSDKDTGLTYCGMVKFLQSEMENSAVLEGKGSSAKIRVYKQTARKMMQRSEAFTLAIRTLYPHHVRLSMHPSSGAAKLSIALIPTGTGDFQKSPWHSCVAVELDGTYRCVHSEDVRDTHDLICQRGRPYFFRARDSD